LASPSKVPSDNSIDRSTATVYAAQQGEKLIKNIIFAANLKMIYYGI